MLAAGLAWRFGQESRRALVLALAGGWAVTEYLRATLFTGFAWNPVGVTFLDTPIVELARVIGTYGLSAFVVLAGGAVWLACRRKWFPLMMFGVLALLLAGVRLGHPTVLTGKSTAPAKAAMNVVAVAMGPKRGVGRIGFFPMLSIMVNMAKVSTWNRFISL